MISVIMTPAEFQATLCNLGACWTRNFPIRLNNIVAEITS